MSRLSDETLNGIRSSAEYAEALADEFLNAWIARQIRVLREDRGWTQADLAARSDMKQSRISALEDIDYSSWSVNTLRRLAHAFGVTLAVEFRGYGKRLNDFDRFESSLLNEPPRTDDPILEIRSAPHAADDAPAMVATTAPSPIIEGRAVAQSPASSTGTAAHVFSEGASPESPSMAAGTSPRIKMLR